MLRLKAKGLQDESFILTAARWVTFGGSYPGMVAAYARQNSHTP
jgi:hypothetical protein